MRMPFANRLRLGQTSVEYVLLLAVVAVVVIAGFAKNSIIDQVHNSAQGYYNTVTRVIMDSDGVKISGGTATDLDNPAPIDGGWCPLSCSSGYGPTVMYGACECPAPAFGGKYCPDSGSDIHCSGDLISSNPNQGSQCKGKKVICDGATACTCPSGQICVPTTQSPSGCACPNGLNCSLIPHSAPNGTCDSCDCFDGTYWNAAKKSCDYCQPQGSLCATSTDHKTCSTYACPENMNCDVIPNTPGYNSCQCNIGTIYTGPGCTSCTPKDSTTCSTSTDGKTCVAESKCPSGMYCNSTVGDSGYDSCQCILDYHWDATGKDCTKNACAALPANSHATVCNTLLPANDGAPYTYVSTCDTTTACQAKCNSGYEPYNGACVNTSCPAEQLDVTQPPDPAENVAIPKTPDGQSVSVACPVTGSGASKICWKGNPLLTCGYGVWGTPSSYCTKSSCVGECTTSYATPAPCSVTFPANTASGTKMTEFCPKGCSGNPATATCSNTKWTLNTNPCVANTCGTLPANSTKCTGTPLPDGNNTPYTLVSACDTANACEAKCSSGYELYNGACVSTTCAAKTSTFTGTENGKPVSVSVTIPKTNDGLAVSVQCPSTASGSSGVCWQGDLTATCSYGSWGAVSGTCVPVSCTDKCVHAKTTSGKCPVTFPANTANGTVMTEYCPANCSGGPMTDTCSGAAWGLPSGTCLANCSAKTVGSGTCAVTLPGGVPSSSSSSASPTAYSCPSGCSGNPINALCYDGSWSTSGGPCQPDCPAKVLSLNGTTASFQATNAGATGTGFCSAVGGNGATAVCSTSGSWGTATGTCCPAKQTWNGSKCVVMTDGVCGTTKDTCKAGTPGSFSKTGNTDTWTCTGTNGGTTAQCSSTCTPLTSCPAGNCGTHSDGCGGTINCAACTKGTCLAGSCVQTTCGAGNPCPSGFTCSAQGYCQCPATSTSAAGVANPCIETFQFPATTLGNTAGPYTCHYGGQTQACQAYFTCENVGFVFSINAQCFMQQTCTLGNCKAGDCGVSNCGTLCGNCPAGKTCSAAGTGGTEGEGTCVADQ